MCTPACRAWIFMTDLSLPSDRGLSAPGEPRNPPHSGKEIYVRHGDMFWFIVGANPLGQCRSIRPDTRRARSPPRAYAPWSITENRTRWNMQERDGEGINTIVPGEFSLPRRRNGVRRGGHVPLSLRRHSFSRRGDARDFKYALAPRG